MTAPVIVVRHRTGLAPDSSQSTDNRWVDGATPVAAVTKPRRFQVWRDSQGSYGRIRKVPKGAVPTHEL